MTTEAVDSGIKLFSSFLYLNSLYFLFIIYYTLDFVAILFRFDKKINLTIFKFEIHY